MSMQGMGGGQPPGYGPPGGAPGQGPGGYGPPQGAPPGFGPQGAPQQGFGPTDPGQPGFTQQGAPPGYGPQGAPQQGFGPQGAPAQGFGPQGAPQPGFDPQGAPQQGFGPQGAPPQGYGQPGMPPQGYGPQGAPQPGFAPQAAPPKKGGKGLLIVLIIVGVVLLLGAGGAGLWFALGGGFGKSASTAHGHLPKGCEAVLRLDVQSVLKAPAFEKHVLPAIEEKGKGSDDAKDFDAFLETAGIDPKKDIKDFAICLKNLGKGEPDMVFILGGDFSPGKVVDAMVLHAKKGKLKEPRELEGLKVVEAKDDDFILGQADDGAVLFGNKLDLMKSAARATDGGKAYDIALDKDLVGLVTDKAMAGLTEQAGQSPFGSAFKGAGKVTLEASLSANSVEARMTMPDANAATEAATGINMLVEMAKEGAKGASSGSPEAMAQDALKELKVSADGKDLVAKVKLPTSVVNDAAKELGKAIRDAKKEGVKL